MFGLFKNKSNAQKAEVCNASPTVDETVLKAVANEIAINTITTMQEGFQQSQELRKNEYDLLLQKHRSLVAAIEGKPYTGPATQITLSPKEILFLWYVDGKPSKAPNIAIYWTYEHNLGDFNALIKKFIEAGYLSISDYRFNMTKCTIAKLKEVLVKNSLAVSGKKAILTQRLEDSISKEDLEKEFNESYLQITKLGEQLLGNYKHLIIYHQYKNFMGNLTPEKLEGYHKENQGLNEYDLLIQYHKHEVVEWEKDANHRIPVSTYYTIAKLYELKGDRITAISWYFMTCYIYQSGTLENAKSAEIDASDYEPGGLFYKSDEDIKNMIEIPGVILCDTQLCIENLQLSETEIKNAYNQATEGLQLQEAVYNRDECFSIIIENLKNILSEKI